MRKIALLASLAGLFVTPASAANFTGKDASAATITFVNPQNCTTGCVPIFSWYDSTGANAVAVVTAGADAQSNTANGGLTYGRNLVFNGTTWDRWTGAVTNAGTFAVQLTGATNNINNIAGTISLPTGAATSAAQTTAQTSLSSIDTKTPALGQAVAGSSSPVVLPAAQITALTPPTTVTVIQPTGTNLHTVVDNTNANGRAVSGSSSPVVPTPALTTWHLIAANTTNATSVKGSAATLFSCQLGGIAGPAFLKIYNKATAPTVGTDVPVKTLIIPVASTAANGAGSNISFGPGGLTLSTGFAAAVTGVITDADTTAVAAASFALNCDYE